MRLTAFLVAFQRDSLVFRLIHHCCYPHRVFLMCTNCVENALQSVDLLFLLSQSVVSLCVLPFSYTCYHCTCIPCFFLQFSIACNFLQFSVACQFLQSCVSCFPSLYFCNARSSFPPCLTTEPSPWSFITFWRNAYFVLTICCLGSVGNVSSFPCLSS